MIKIKQIKRGSSFYYIITFILFIFLYKSCITSDLSKKSNKRQVVYESDEWIRGKRLFLDNCAFCHTPFNKDEIFDNFNHNLNKKGELVAIDSLAAIFSDSIHNQILGIDTFSVNQLKDIYLYIKTPRKSGIID